ncbi:IS4 family transposase [Candidatus Kaiserbacteria bacterium]|nr:IS4 family transposase [Candidatus Kaiserbacteria bacterium]
MRFQKTVEKLSEQPLSSINQACGSWADTKGAYRMFDNNKVETHEILAPHQLKTRERIGDQSRILVIQDTSFINYTEHFKTKGLGPIGHVNKKKATKADSQGLIMHTALAVSTQGLPLGILDQEIWSREDEEQRPHWRKKACRKRVPAERKESYKWLRALMRTTPLIPPGVQAVTVCDRESDMYELIAKAEALKTHYLIRSSWDRAIQAEHEDYYLWDYMAELPVAGTFEIEAEAKRVAKQKVAEKRMAKLEVRFACVELRRNPKKKMDRAECLAFMPSYVVWVKELKPPQGIEPLEWMLLTNVPVKSFEDAVERVNWYKLRWHIENFHKVLKSGCNIELCRLETAERLERYVTLFSIIAWRLYWLTHISRASPDASCAMVLADHEWKALYCKMKKTRALPSKPPTIREAIRWIASLGGFLGRKGDGEPGITTTWRGWQRLLDISEAWLVFNSSRCG